MPIFFKYECDGMVCMYVCMHACIQADSLPIHSLICYRREVSAQDALLHQIQSLLVLRKYQTAMKLILYGRGLYVCSSLCLGFISRHSFIFFILSLARFLRFRWYIRSTCVTHNTSV